MGIVAWLNERVSYSSILKRSSSDYSWIILTWHGMSIFECGTGEKSVMLVKIGGVGDSWFGF
jgi:hypothetical protein